MVPFKTGASLLSIAFCVSAMFVGSAAIEHVGTAEGANFQKKLLKLHNRARKKAGRPKLRLSSSLIASAQLYAEDMAATGVFSHVGADGSTFDQRIAAQGGNFSTMAENIAQGQTSAKKVHKAWMRSTGHKRNILNKRFRSVGFGMAGVDFYWVANFGN